MTAPAPLSEAKRTLRARCLRRRAELGAEDRLRASAALARTGLGFLDPMPGAVVSGYWPIRDELDPRPLLEALAAAGHPLALPVVLEDDAPLGFRRWRPGDPTATDALGLRVPTESAPTLLPDIVLVPLLAVDAAGYRLGYGKGHFDRTLAALRAQRRIAAVGIGFDEQRIDAVPHEPHDERLDWVLTPSGPRAVSK